MKLDRSMMTILITGVMWFGIVISCTSGRRESTTRTEYKHGSKIVVRYNAEQNKTFFSQDDIKISPAINIGPQRVTGKHAFEINSTAESQGIGSSPEKVTLTLLHDTPTKTGWQYPRPANFALIADGQRFEVYCDPNYPIGKEAACAQSSPLKKDDPSDTDYYEALFMDLPFQTFAAIGNAKSVQLNFGTASFELPAETVLAFHDFAEIMSGK